MTQTQSLSALVAKLTLLITTIVSLLHGGSGLTNQNTFGLGTGAANVSASASSTVGQPTCFNSFSNQDNSWGINTCPYMNAVYTATTTYPNSAITLGPFGSTTSTTSTTITAPFGTANNLTAGDPCLVFFNNSSTLFGLLSNITGAVTSTATTTINVTNLSSGLSVLNTTSSFTGVSSTLKVTCYNTVN